MINDCVIPSFIPRVVKLTSVHHPQVDTINILAYTRMPPSYLYHSVSWLPQRSAKIWCQQTSRVFYPEVLQIAPGGAKFYPHDFDHPQPSIWLNSCLRHTSSTAHASIVNIAGQEILIYCGFFYELLVAYTSVQFRIPCHHDSHTALGKCSQKFGNYVS